MFRFEFADGRRLVWGAAILLIAAIVSASSFILFSQRQIALEKAGDEMSNVADSVVQDLIGTFELSNTVLVFLHNSIHASDGTIREMASASGDVAAIASTAPRLREVLFAEVGGWVLASSLGKDGNSRNVSREAFFAEVARPKAPDLVVARSKNDEGIAISRRIEDADGMLAGVVASIVPEAYFRKTYASFDAGRGIRVDVRRTDGTPLFGYGSGEALPDDRSTVRDLSPLPFRVTASWSRKAMLHDWRQRLPIHVAVTAALVLLTSVAAFLLLRLLRRKREEGRTLALLAATDPLTGVGNRRGFIDSVRRQIEGSGPSGFAVVLLDLDRFKSINDTHGHAAGDVVLQHVAREFDRLIGPFGTVARLGGDEFAAVFNGDAPTLRPILEELHRALAAQIVWKDVSLSTGASIGVAWSDRGGGDAETLLQSADLAMYHAKQHRRNETRVFEPGMEAVRRSRRERERELRDAIREAEIRAYYQPIVVLPERRVVGFELLARWHHPSKGVLAPGEFIALAEETSLITPLTIGLIRQAAADMRAWPSDIRLAINISPRQLREPLLAVQIVETLRASGLDPSRIEIEITEDGILDDYDLAKNVMSLFRLHGITLALDDFGTGYSSLAHLRELRFDRLKIDRSFVQALPGNGESRKLVEAVLHLAASFEMEVTAEGVESAEQAAFLCELRCQRAQGYLFGRAVPAETVPNLIGRDIRAA